MARKIVPVIGPWIRKPMILEAMQPVPINRESSFIRTFSLGLEKNVRSAGIGPATFWTATRRSIH